MNIDSYSHPVNQLFNYPPGTDNLSPAEWPDYQELGITALDIPELICMVTDESLYNLDDHDYAVFGKDSLLEYAPLHAIRVLGQLRAETAIEPLISLFPKTYNFKSDALYGFFDELTDVLSLIGLPVIPAITAYLADPSHDENSQSQAIYTLKKLAFVYPEHHADCVSILFRHLKSFEENSPEFNAHLISALSDLKAIDSLPIIEQAFEAGCVDDDFLDWDDVQVKFGLKSSADVQSQSLESLLYHHIPKILSNRPTVNDNERLKKAQQKRQARRKRNSRNRVK